MKRKIERVLRALFLATMILILSVAIWSPKWKSEKARKSDDLVHKVQAESLPNDPYWSFQWGAKKIEADWAWNTTFGDSSILVAVLDSGVDYNHPDLEANYVPLGYDWVNNDTDPMDDYGHGTKVAGVIAAQINNGLGITGLAQVKIMAEKVLDEKGEGSIEQLAKAINHSTGLEAEIISMSLSTGDNDPLLYNAVKYAYDSGVLLVAAAGNQGSDVKRFPAAYNEVIAVTATDPDDIPSDFSNFGDWVELAAPGRNIFTTAHWYITPYGYYDYASGTSLACPYVSGLAALLWSEIPNATRDWVRTKLRDTADDLGSPGFDDYYGYGRINARKALNVTFTVINYTLTITTTANGTTSPPPGNYTYASGVSIRVTAIPSMNYTLDHWELDGADIGATNPITITMNANHTLQSIFALIFHDPVITDIIPSKNVVGRGYSISINVTVVNQGNCPENFNLTAYANTTIIQIKTIDLTAGDCTTITFTWNTTGFTKGNYTIWAYLEFFVGAEQIDNTKDGGTVLVSIPGDVNSDHLVDISDLVITVNAIPSLPEQPNWNPNADINNDGVCDVSDLVICIGNIPSHW